MSLRPDIVSNIQSRLAHTNEVIAEEDKAVIDPVDYQQPQARSRTTDIVTLPTFYELFKKIINTAAEMQGKAYDLPIVRFYNPDEGSLPCISVKLLKREPFSANGVSERLFRHMETRQDPDHPGMSIRTGLNRQQNLLEFTVWTKDRILNDEICDWLEEVYSDYLFALRWAGGQPIIWEGRGEDGTISIRSGQIVHYSPIIFTVITQRLQHIREANLNDLKIRVGLSNGPY